MIFIFANIMKQTLDIRCWISDKGYAQSAHIFQIGGRVGPSAAIFCFSPTHMALHTKQNISTTIPCGFKEGTHKKA